MAQAGQFTNSQFSKLLNQQRQERINESLRPQGSGRSGGYGGGEFEILGPGGIPFNTISDPMAQIAERLGVLRALGVRDLPSESANYDEQLRQQEAPLRQMLEQFGFMQRLQRDQAQRQARQVPRMGGMRSGKASSGDGASTGIRFDDGGVVPPGRDSRGLIVDPYRKAREASIAAALEIIRGRNPSIRY